MINDKMAVGTDTSNKNNHIGHAIDTIINSDSSDDAKKKIHKHLETELLSTLKSKAGNLLDSTEVVKDSFNQQKYSRLANASYDYFNSNGDADAVEKGLSDPDYAHLGLEDKSLSSIDNVVMHNKTGETHISFRGTTDDPKKTDQFLSDWNTNGKIMFNPKAAENSTRFSEAGAQTEKVIAKYGKRFTTVSGHSMGGGISSLIAQEKDIRGFHFNPAISPKQVSDNSKGLFSKILKNRYCTKHTLILHLRFHTPNRFGRTSK